MRHRWVLPALLAACSCQANDDWIALFDGESLDRWIPKIRGFAAGEDPFGTFRIADGAITVAYDRYDAFDDRFGHLFFDTPYSHYRLQLEYRFIGEQAAGGEEWAWRNSGVMFHAQAPDTMPDAQDFPISIEFQFLGGRADGAPRPTGAMCSPGTDVEVAGARAATHCVPAAAPTFAGDDWIQVELVVDGAARAVHFVEGATVIEYGNLAIGGGVVSDYDPEVKLDGTPLAGGYIALQSESHPIQFRRIRLLNLKGCMDPDATNFRDYFIEPDTASCRY